MKMPSMKMPTVAMPTATVPTVDMRGKFATMNEKVKSARMPSPYELKESYLNSGFHKSFKQPLGGHP